MPSNLIQAPPFTFHPHDIFLDMHVQVMTMLNLLDDPKPPNISQGIWMMSSNLVQ